MSAFVIAQLKFVNEANYRKYEARFASVFEKYSGQLLIADEHALVLEGAWNGDKIVVMSFPDEQTTRLFLESPEYSEISQDRKSGAETVALLVKGVR